MRHYAKRYIRESPLDLCSTDLHRPIPTSIYAKREVGVKLRIFRGEFCGERAAKVGARAIKPTLTGPTC
jgi:hypothetical protein